ncbi:MAG: DsbA family protein [Gaiellaceae bacterium MAG52_C11]|nr:DsbA family protein [Candidatus Gaiellasilicea maunaloa]
MATWLGRRFGAAVVWLPFDLHPEYPPEGLPRAQLLARYGEGMTERMRTTFGARGLEYNPSPDVVPNTMRALRLTELARELGRHEETHDRLMDAYWAEAQDLGDPAVLRTLAAEVELPRDEVEAVLDGDRYRERIEDSTRQAVSIGANAVPAFLLDRRLLVLGAQPEAVFEQAVARLEAP